MSQGICEMCGHHVAMRQKAHIVAEGSRRRENLLLLCPSCHLMFDSTIKPRLWKALTKAGVSGLPNSWQSSIYDQAAAASAAARSKKGKKST